MASVLSLVQEFSGKKTLPVPSAVVGSTDKGIIQIRYLLAEVVRELSQYRWPQQKIEKTFSAIALQDQGAFTSVLGADYRSLVPGTFWHLTLDQEIKGPATDREWAAMKAAEISGTEYYYKPIADHLHIYPIPVALDSLYVIYESAYGVANSGGTPIAEITADTDTFLLPEILVHRSLDYRWKRQKGEPWAADYNEYMSLLAKQLGRDTLPTLSLDSSPKGVHPGIWVPAGNWAQ